MEATNTPIFFSSSVLKWTFLVYLNSIKIHQLTKIINNDDYDNDDHRVLQINHFTHWKDRLPSEDGTDRLYRNVGNDLPLQDA